MAPKKKKVATTKVKKKRWYPIHAPKLFNEKLLGETYIAEEEALMGKYMTANLSTVAGSMKKQSMNVQFRVNKVDEGKGYTEIVGYGLVTAALKRLVRRGRNKIIDSFLAKTKDKNVMRIKTMIITHNRGTKSAQSAVRLQIRKFIREYAFTKDTQDLFADIVELKLQKMSKDSSSKIFPLKSVDIKTAKLDESGKTVVTDNAVKSEEVVVRVREKGEEHMSEAELAARDKTKALAAEDNDAIDVPESDEVNDNSSDSEDFGEEESEDSSEPVQEQADPEDASDEELEANLEEEDKEKLADN